MKKLIVAIVFCLCAFFGAKAQTIYSCQYRSDADVKVYVTNYKSEADLVVYRCDYRSDANGNDGLWYFVKYKSDAKKRIYFVNYRSEAGWRDKSKQYLFY